MYGCQNVMMKFEFTVEKIADIISPLCTIGQTDCTVTRINNLKEAQHGDVSFLSNMKYHDDVESSNASILILPIDFQYKEKNNQVAMFCPNTSIAIARICTVIEKLNTPKNINRNIVYEIHSSAIIDVSSKLMNNVYIGAFSIIGKHCNVAELCVIANNVTIGNDVAVGKNVHIGSNVVIGCNVKIADNVIIESNVTIDDNVVIGCNSRIKSNSTIGNDVNIGDDCLIYNNVSVIACSQIGNRVVLHPGCVIGSDGFGFVPFEGKIQKIPQIGNVILEDDVDIGSNTTIDRARFASTIVKKETKIDNLVQVGHNVEIGEQCLIVSQVGIAGSSRIENNVTIGGQVGVAGHINIGKNTQICAQSGISKNVPANSVMFGSPACQYKDAVRQLGALAKLPRFMKDLKGYYEKML